MKLKNITSNSMIGFVNTIMQPSHIDKQMVYLNYNQPWLNTFNRIVLSLNGDENYCKLLVEEAQKILKPEIVLLYSKRNLGHTFGTFDNDKKIFDYAKQHRNIGYVWKFSGDVIAEQAILDVEIDDSNDFFYINNLGYVSFSYNSKEQMLEKMMSGEYLYPQTNYYISKNKIEVWYPSDAEIIEYHDRYQEILKEHPTYYPWDALSGEDVGLDGPKENQGCDCEGMLSKTVRANNLKTQMLISEEDNKKIIDLIHTYKMHDGSHKNIMYTNVGNLCHFHYIGHPVATI